MTESLREGQENSVVETRHTPWMITFADLLSLLLTFFVLLFSMQSVPTDSWDAVVETMTQEFNPARLETSPIKAPQQTPQGAATPRRGLNLGYLATILDSNMEGVPSMLRAKIYQSQAGLVISLPADDLFGAKNAVFQNNAESAVQHLAQSLIHVRNKVLIAAHTDIASPDLGYETNWDLSMARARKIAIAVRQAGYGRPVTALGYGASRFDTLDPDLTLDRRYQLAGRIDLVILNEQRNTDIYDIF